MPPSSRPSFAAFCGPLLATPSRFAYRPAQTCTRTLHAVPLSKKQLSSSSFAPGFSRVATPVTTSSTNARPAIQCNLPGNVEDLPLYRVPNDINLMPPDWNKPGVYGVYSNSGDLNFVASAKNVASALHMHLQYVESPKINVHSVRMMTVDVLDAESTKPLNAFAERWVMALHENGLPVPVGNTDEGEAWRIAPAQEDVSFSNQLIMPTEEERVKEEIELILKNHKVVLFMKGTRHAPKCGFSKAVVDIVSEQTEASGTNFVCVDCLDANKNGGLREGIKMYSNWPTIPQLYIDGDFIGGADIVEEMEQNGELAAALAS